MQVGIVGGGTIARLFLERIRAGELGDARIVAILGRTGSERCRALARDYGIPCLSDVDALIGAKPAAVIEAAAHEWIERHGPIPRFLRWLAARPEPKPLPAE